VVVVVVGAWVVVMVVVVGAAVVVVVAGAAVVVVVVGALIVVVVAWVVVVGPRVVVVARWFQARWLGGVAPKVPLTAKELIKAAIATARTTPPAKVRRRRIGEAT
jgi:hypothetical protein